MKRVAEATVTPLVRFVEWLFGPHAPGIDLLLGLFAAAWGGLMLMHPHLFDRGAFVGMGWLPDAVWKGFFAVLAALHALGFFRPWLRTVRVAACLLSAWIWITVSMSLYRVELTTGVLIYPIVGCAALCGALYLSGQPRKAA